MNIFIVGATGFIGGSVAEQLRVAGHHIRGLARNEAAASGLRERGIEPVAGSLEDGAILEAAARAADAVISAADADHRPSVEALLRGLAGSKKTFIHTSGSSIVSTDAQGEPTTDVFDDDTAFEPVPEKAHRVAIDRDVLAAAGKGLRSIVICPTMIYGDGLGVRKDSVQIPALVKEAKSSGTAHWIGRGENVWSNVHIEDVADLYLLAFEKSPAGAFYFAENGEERYRAIAEGIGRHLSIPAGSLSAEDATRIWGFDMGRLGLASNSRVRAKRARALGWKPHRISVLEWLAAAKL